MPIPPLSKVVVQFNPYVTSFGNIPVSTTVGGESVLISSTGTETANIVIQPQDPRITATPSGNISIPVGSSITVNFSITTTSSTGTINSQFFFFQGGTYLANGPTVTATVIAGGTAPVWKLSPGAINFGSLKIGSASAPVTCTISNTGSSVLTVSAVTLDASEFTLAGVPAVPFSVAAGGTQTFTIACESEFRGLNDYNPGLTVTPSLGVPQTIELEYTGFLLTPAFTLTGATQGVLFGLAGVWNNAQTNIVSPADQSLPPEAPQSLIKMHDFGNPSALTYANRLYMRTEPLGEVTATLTSQAIASETLNTSSDTKPRDTTNDSTGIPTQLIFDVETNGEIHKLTLTIEANVGILSIIEYTPCYETRGQVYESK